MDDKGRFIIPGEFRKDGKAFIGDSFEEINALKEEKFEVEANKYARRLDEAIKLKTKELQNLK